MSAQELPGREELEDMGEESPVQPRGSPPDLREPWVSRDASPRPRALTWPAVCSLLLLLLGSLLGPEVTATAILPWFRLAPLHPAKQRRVTPASPWFCSALPPPSLSAPTLAAPTWLVPRWPRPRASAPFCSPWAEPGSALLNSLTDSGQKLRTAAWV